MFKQNESLDKSTQTMESSTSHQKSTKRAAQYSGLIAVFGGLLSFVLCCAVILRYIMEKDVGCDSYIGGLGCMIMSAVLAAYSIILVLLGLVHSLYAFVNPKIPPKFITIPLTMWVLGTVIGLLLSYPLVVRAEAATVDTVGEKDLRDIRRIYENGASTLTLAATTHLASALEVTLRAADDFLLSDNTQDLVYLRKRMFDLDLELMRTPYRTVLPWEKPPRASQRQYSIMSTARRLHETLQQVKKKTQTSLFWDRSLLMAAAAVIVFLGFGIGIYSGVVLKEKAETRLNKPS